MKTLRNIRKGISLAQAMVKRNLGHGIQIPKGKIMMWPEIALEKNIPAAVTAEKEP
jgi:hypothetical protein